MQALLLATGEQPKLHPLTERRPSAMLAVGHQPVMAHLLELLAAQGLKRAVVCLHDRPASIEAYFGAGERWGVRLEYVIVRGQLGSAGVLRRARRLLTETCLVLPADVILDLDITAALAEHRRQRALATQVVAAEPARQPGSGRNGAAAAGQAEARAHGQPIGVYVFEPGALDLIPPHQASDIEQDLMPQLRAAGHRVIQAPLSGYWNRLASFQDLSDAQHAFLARLHAVGEAPVSYCFPRLSSVRGRRVSQGVWVGRNCAIHPSVRIAAPVYIGSNCRIDREVELGPYAVVGANVVIEAEATVRQSTVFDNTFIGQLVKIENRLVDGSLVVAVPSGEHVRVSDACLLSATHETLSESLAHRYRDALLAGALLALTLPLGLLWGLAVWLATGRVFARKHIVKPAPARADAARMPELTALLNFHHSRENRLAAGLSRWQDQLEIVRWPELLNVVAGQLALVGAKPATPDEHVRASALRHEVQATGEPGFTGLWYLQTHDHSDPDEVVIADAYYAATRSWREDLRILAHTPAAWLKRVRSARGEAYGHTAWRAGADGNRHTAD